MGELRNLTSGRINKLSMNNSHTHLNKKSKVIIMASFSAVIHKEDGYYVAKCPEVGTASQGRNLDEALKNLKEATELYLEEFPFKKCGNPIMTVFEVATHA